MTPLSDAAELHDHPPAELLVVELTGPSFNRGRVDVDLSAKVLGDGELVRGKGESDRGDDGDAERRKPGGVVDLRLAEGPECDGLGDREATAREREGLASLAVEALGDPELLVDPRAERRDREVEA